MEALKARGYDDVALVYLKKLKESGEAPPELDAELDYKIGAAAYENWLEAKSGPNKEKLAEEARAAFRKYVEASPEGENAPEANMGLAKLTMAEGAKALEASKRKGISSEEREGELARARALFSSAVPLAGAARGALERWLRDATKRNAGISKTEARQGLFLEAKLLSATIKANLARTFPEKSEERTKGLRDAIDEYREFYEKYGSFAASFTARYLSAECLRELGALDAALELLSELAMLPSEEPFYALKTRSLALFASIADETNVPERNMSLVQKYEIWKEKDKLPQEFYASAEGRRIQLSAGRALVRLENLRRDDFGAFARAGKRTFVDKDEPMYNTLNVPEKKKEGVNTIVTYAINTLTELANGSGTVANEAKELLKDKIFEGIDLGKFSVSKKKKGEAGDFESAVDAATNAIATYAQANSELVDADPAVAGEARQVRDEAGLAAIKAIRVALDWGARATMPDRRGRYPADMAEIRGKIDDLCDKYASICFALDRLEDALVLSERLARRGSTSEVANRGATLALNALRRLVAKASATDPDGELAARRRADLTEFADWVRAKWGEENPDSSAVQEAAFASLESAVNAGNVEEAKALVEAISETSSKRSDAELLLGRTLWVEWNRLRAAQSASARAEEGAEAPPQVDQAALDAMLESSRAALYDGLERVLGSSVGATEDDWNAIYSTYLLASVYDKLGNAEESNKWLTHPVIGARTLVEKILSTPEEERDEFPSFAGASFQAGVLSLALSAEVADPNKLDAALKTMETLEGLVGDSADASKKLAGVYLQLGKRLEERVSDLKSASDAGDDSKKAELEATIKGFEAFLNRVAEGDASYANLNWAAEGYLSLGKGISPPDVAPSAEAIAYFKTAGKTFQKILDKAESNSAYATAKQLLATQLRISECLLLSRDYEKSLGVLKTILAEKENANNVDVQMAAARALQGRGREKPEYYLTAIAGESSKSNVWGWNKLLERLGRQISQSPRVKTLYYECLVEKTTCRYEYLRRGVKDKSERSKLARNYEDEIIRTLRVHPDLGGHETFKKIDSLYKTLQKVRGVSSPKGLKQAAREDKEKSSK